jgi:hypothetical protein
MKTTRKLVTISLTALSVAIAAVSLLEAKQKDPRTVKEIACDNAYARCVVNCKRDAGCLKACGQGWDKCNGYPASHAKPPINLPNGPIHTLPNASTSTEKSTPKASPSASPNASAKPKNTKKPTH